MKKVKGLLLFGVALTVAIFVYSTNPGMAADAELVKIHHDVKENKIDIEPATITVKKNTILVWLSGVENNEVQIVFNEGKTCKDVTANPNLKMPGFFMDSKNCYVTSFLPYSATSTLMFPQTGKYEYRVVSADGKLEGKGEILVEE